MTCDDVHRGMARPGLLDEHCSPNYNVSSLCLVSIVVYTNISPRVYTLYDNDPFPATCGSVDTVKILSKRALSISQRSNECCFFLAVL